MSRFWSSSRADGGLSFAFHLFSSLSTRHSFFCSPPLICCKSSWAEKEKREEKNPKNNKSKLQHRPSLLHINSLSTSASSRLHKVFLFSYSEQIRKDAVSEVLVRQPWHVAIHSSLMWQGPSIAKPLLLLRRLLITVDKQAGGDTPPLPAPPPHLPSIHTK